MTRTELQTYIHQNLPLTAHMGVQVVRLDETGLALEAPLAPNINHKRTAFGGSISSLAIVCAWSAIHVYFRRRGIATELVIRRSEVAYLKPVSAAFRASAVWPDEEQAEHCLTALRRHRPGRLRMTAGVDSEGVRCAELNGEFVALPGRAKDA